MFSFHNSIGVNNACPRRLLRADVTGRSSMRANAANRSRRSPHTAYARVCDVISFLMVFMCLLLSIFSTIRQYNEASSYILYYLVSLYTLRSTFFKLLFELHLTSLLDDSTSFVRLRPWAITLLVTLSKTNKSHG